MNMNPSYRALAAGIALVSLFLTGCGKTKEKRDINLLTDETVTATISWKSPETTEPPESTELPESTGASETEETAVTTVISEVSSGTAVTAASTVIAETTKAAVQTTAAATTKAAATTVKATTAAPAATAAATTAAVTAPPMPTIDESAYVSSLQGKWVQNSDFSCVLTVEADGSYTLNAAGTLHSGKIRYFDGVADGSGSRYAFYEGDALWKEFPNMTQLAGNTICASDGTIFTIIDSTPADTSAGGPSIAEGRELRTALQVAESFMNCSIGCDTSAGYIAADGSTYFRVADPNFRTVSDVRTYLERYMTPEYIASKYSSLFGGDMPGCMDFNGELCILYRPVGGIYSFNDSDPIITRSGDNTYSVFVADNDYGYDTVAEIVVTGYSGNWKISNVYLR